MTAIAILDAEHRVQRIENAAVNVCFALRAERQAVDDRDELLITLRNQLIGQPNPVTNKPHSATSAEESVKLTEQYKAADAERIMAECKHIMALADYERAKLNAQLAVIAARGCE